MSASAIAVVAAAPFAAVVAWLWAARRMHGVEAGSLVDAIPWVGWARMRARGAPGAGFRLALEIGAPLVALWAVLVTPAAWAWPTAALGWLLLTASTVDARDGLLPDGMNAALAGLGLAAAALVGRATFVDHAIGLVAGYGVFVAVAAVFARLRGREGLGRGDAKLLGAGGAWVGWQGLASVVLIAATAALITVAVSARLRGRTLRGDAAAPFGPFLSLGVWLTWLYGPLGLG